MFTILFDAPATETADPRADILAHVEKCRRRYETERREIRKDIRSGFTTLEESYDELKAIAEHLGYLRALEDIALGEWR